MNSVFIPEVLRARDQWLCWKLETRDGKPSKVPYDAKTGRYGKSNDPTTWCGFETVVKAVGANGYSGIGFAFREGDGLAGVDVDYSWGSPVATEIREHFKGTYCERSPSEKLRIFCFGKPLRCGKGTGDKAIELYDYTSPRYLTVTGGWIEGTAREVTGQQAALEWLHERYFRPKEEPKPKKPKGSGPELTLGDQEIIDRARAARNGGKFSSLFYGGWEAEGYPSQSEADAALCSMLAFWTQDEGQIDRIFRQSALMRGKWDERHHADGRTYGQATIERALSTVAETYRPGDHREEPPPWEDPPVETYADDPECRGRDRDSGSQSGESGESGEKAHGDSFSGWRSGGERWRIFIERAREALLSNAYEPSEYPVDALGPLADVCRGIAELGQMTTAMAGQCVLGSAALLCQSRADVHTLAGDKPLSLYLLTIGESGDGKTTGEDIALKPVAEYQRRATRAFKAELKRYEAEMDRRKKGDPIPDKPREPYTTWKVSSFAGRQSLCLSGWH